MLLKHLKGNQNLMQKKEKDVEKLLRKIKKVFQNLHQKIVKIVKIINWILGDLANIATNALEE